MNYKWVILSKLGHFEYFELNTLSCRVFRWLFEYHKIIEIGQVELELSIKVYMPSYQVESPYH